MGHCTLPSRGYNPSCGNPADAPIREPHLEPVGTLADNLQLCTVRHLVDDTRRKCRAAANVGGGYRHDGDVLRHRRHQSYTHFIFHDRFGLLDDSRPQVCWLEILSDFDRSGHGHARTRRKIGTEAPTIRNLCRIESRCADAHAPLPWRRRTADPRTSVPERIGSLAMAVVSEAQCSTCS